MRKKKFFPSKEREGMPRERMPKESLSPARTLEKIRTFTR